MSYKFEDLRGMTPLDNHTVWKLVVWARRSIPKLRNLSCQFCLVCDEAHAQDKRLYAHTHHYAKEPHVICFARAIVKLSPNTLAGICLHEFGHVLAGNRHSEADAEMAADLAISKVLEPLGVTLTYRGRRALQWVNFARLLREIENA